MCLDRGFALAGVCDARRSDHADDFRAWIERGEHGTMAWLARNVETRLDPGRLVEGARSIIVVADQYATRNDAPDTTPRGHGRIARYARGDDYHVAMKRRLHAVCDALRARFAAETFRACVDTAPLLEREHAARAGLGWIGKHTLLINPERGSWLLLGAVVTTLHVPPPREHRAVPDHCGTCTRCIDACPTGAITPYAVDARRCISYLTIERREPIDPALHAPIGDRLFGCDVCQEVCPHNSPRADGAGLGAAHGAYTPRRSSFPVGDVRRWVDDDRRTALRGSAMKRATLEMFHRNAAIVAANAARSVSVSAPSRTTRPPSPS